MLKINTQSNPEHFYVSYYKLITNLEHLNHPKDRTEIRGTNTSSSLATGEPDCNSTSVGHHFLPIEEADYYLNEFSQPLRNVSAIDDCKIMCSSNCSCTAAFFHNSSASCYLVTGPLNSLKAMSNQTYKGYIKVQNNMPPNQTSASKSSSVGIIAGITIGSAAVALFLCLIIIVTIQSMRKSKVIEDDMCEEEIDPEEMEEEAFLKTLPGLPPRFTYHELMEATDNFSKILGTGGFGSVYEGVLRDTSKVAVKKLDGPRQGYKEFRAEVATIGSISHLNLNCRGSQSSKSKKENRSRSDDNGAVTDIVLSKDSNLLDFDSLLS